MNERIKQLAEQAEKQVRVKTKSNLGYMGFEIDEDEFRRVFAELIVRQCAEVGLDSVEDGDDLDAIMKRVHNNILKHFGVEK